MYNNNMHQVARLSLYCRKVHRNIFINAVKDAISILYAIFSTEKKILHDNFCHWGQVVKIFSWQTFYAYSKIPRLRPPLHWAKVGRGFHLQDPYISHDDHYQPSNATWARSLYFLWLFDEQNSRKTTVRHNNMTQIASLLAVPTVFIGLWTLNMLKGGGCLHVYARQNYLRRNSSYIKMQGLMREGGGHNCGFLLWYMCTCIRYLSSGYYWF